MKNIITLLFITLWLNNYSTAQENLSFEKVITLDSTSQDVLFSKVNDWFSVTYNSAKDVIQMSEKESGVIIGNGSTSYSKSGMSYMCYSGYIKYTIKVQVKENRFKVTLTNFSHSAKASSSSQCELGLITTAENYTNSGMSKKYLNAVCNDIKVKMESYSNDIFTSLDNHIKKEILKEGDW